MTSVPEQLSARASESAAAIALSCGDREISYAELEQLSNQMAHWLRGRGAGPEQVIGVCLRRTIELPVALVAVLKAGAAYLPLDPELPTGRREFMTCDAGVQLVLTESALSDHREDIKAQPGTPPEPPPLPSHLAYVLYTSGSTGAPKGVMVQHGQLANYLAWAVPQYMADGSGAPLYSPLTVDLSVTSLFAPLLAGRTVRLLREENPPVTTLPAALADGSFSFVKLTPAHLAFVAEALTPQAMGAAARLVIGGEALTFEQLAPWRRHAPDTLVTNEYGPTEAVVGCCVHTMQAGEQGTGPVPIGTAAPGTWLSVRDGQLALVEPGQIGELCIGGAQVARGYLDRPGLTAQRFVPDPAGPGGRMYRTGDLVRELADGRLVYLGRRDDQVKINGYRVELGEIETVLARSPGVAAATAAIRGSGEGQRIVGYLVPADGAEPDHDAIRAAAAEQLPGYMQPAILVSLKELPLTSSGKVDRAALPDPRPAPTARPAAPADRPARPAANQAAPPPMPGGPAVGSTPAPSPMQSGTGPYQAEVAAVVADVLGWPASDYDLDITDLGGTSRQIAMVIGRLIREYAIALPAESWLRSPSVAGFARLIDAYMTGGATAAKQAYEEPDFEEDLDSEILGTLEKERTGVSQ
jgi:amino acid adenylation domain-containing protein